jgi:hypothetical protein
MQLANKPHRDLTLSDMRSAGNVEVSLDGDPPTIGKLAHSKDVHSHGNHPNPRFASDLAV